MPDLLAPFAHAVAAALAGTHHVLVSTGLAPDAGLTWVLAIAGLVLAVRLLLLPVAIHSVRLARASALARPHLTAVRERYRGRTDPASLRAQSEELRRVQAEHGVSRLGCLPVLLQLPVLFALYHVLADVAAGRTLGALDAALVASAGSAAVLGVHLADRAGALLTSPGHFVVVAALALCSAGLGYATQRWFVLPNTSLEGMPAQLADVQRLLPVLSAAGLLVAAASVPAGLLVYWVASNAVTLVQQAVVTTWFPTPGTEAHACREARLAATAG
ncbi:membrane protein insertase YidC [Mobilicoccus pelagius]|uniref:Membrane protein insertase YidC n=1 Tax=Mobilicoccus pelagius NBRC 104925 TaxID=1089455 RepID=H5UUP2_9MICO|nr:membrane protein insertase YidC [Mobilicoccus pelagius]GAB49450.1 OxaA family protein [Mobilicoccus pelagius NBRC 104925]